MSTKVMQDLALRLRADTAELKRNIRDANNNIKSLQTNTQRVSKAISTNLKSVAKGFLAAFAATAVVSGIRNTISNLTQLADRILDLTQITGANTDTIQEWNYVAKMAGVNAEVYTTAIEGLTQKLARGGGESKTLTDAFDKLGIATKDASGELRKGNIITDDVIDKLSELENVTERNRLGAAIFGGAWKDLAPILGMGKDGIKNLREEAHKLGVVLDSDALAKTDDVRKAFVRLGAQFQNVKNSLVIDFGDVFSGVGTALSNILNLIRPVVQWIGKNIDVLLTLGATWGVYKGTILLVTKAKLGLKAVQTAYNAVLAKTAITAKATSAALLAIPLVKVIALVAALSAGVYLLTNSFSKKNTTLEITRGLTTDINKQYVDQSKELNLLKEIILDSQASLEQRNTAIREANVLLSKHNIELIKVGDSAETAAIKLGGYLDVLKDTIALDVYSNKLTAVGQKMVDINEKIEKTEEELAKRRSNKAYTEASPTSPLYSELKGWEIRLENEKKELEEQEKLFKEYGKKQRDFSDKLNSNSINSSGDLIRNITTVQKELADLNKIYESLAEGTEKSKVFKEIQQLTKELERLDKRRTTANAGTGIDKTEFIELTGIIGTLITDIKRLEDTDIPKLELEWTLEDDADRKLELEAKIRLEKENLNELQNQLSAEYSKLDPVEVGVVYEFGSVGFLNTEIENIEKSIKDIQVEILSATNDEDRNALFQQQIDNENLLNDKIDERNNLLGISNGIVEGSIGHYNALIAANNELIAIQTDPTVIAAFQSQNAEYQNMIDNLRGISNVTEELTVGEIFKKIGDDINIAQLQVQAMSNAFNEVGSAIENAFAGAENAFSGLVDSMLGGIQQIINALLTKAIAGMIAGEAPKGVLGLATAAFGIAALKGLFKKESSNIPKLASGGIAYGRSLVEVGEYAGAKGNPEVIAPLNKLQNMLSANNQLQGEVRFEIDGDRLVGILTKYNNKQIYF